MAGAATHRSYAEALENSSVGLLELGADGTVRHANAALCRMSGRDVNALAGTHWSVLVHPADVDELNAATTSVVGAGASSAECRVRLRRPDAGTRHVIVAVSASPAPTDGAPTALWLVTDVSDLAGELDRARLLAENVTDVVVLGDNDGVMQWVSASVTATTGWQPEDLQGVAFRDLVHPEDLAQVAAAQDALNHAVPGRFLVRLRTADGDHRWTSIRVRPVLDDAGRVVGRVAGWWDVHEQQVAVRRLAESEARYRGALAAELDAHVMLEALRDGSGAVADFVYLDVNHRAGSYLSRPAEEVIGRRLLEMFPRQRESGMFTRYVHTVDTGEPLVLDAVRISSEVQAGERFFDFRAVKVGDGLSLVWRDVTEQVTAAAQLAASEGHYRLLAENASDVVFQGSPDAVMTWVSPSCVEVLGLSAEALVGSRVADLLHPDDVTAMRAASARVNSGDRVTYRARYRHPKHGWRWVEVTAKPVRDDAGTIVSRVGSLRDVHDRVLAEEALAASEAEARDLAARYEVARDAALEASRAKTAFLSRMSHELRTPLNAVLGFAQLLDLDPLTVDQREAVAQIRTGGRHLLDLINDILDISRVEAGRLSLSMESVLVADAATASLDMVRLLADRYGVTLAAGDVGRGETAVWGDRQRTVQILVNLLSNAVKYNHHGGRVTVTCTAIGDGTIGVHVSDTGPGISADDQALLFRAFERLGAEARGVEGTGIGLALSQGLAEAMGGRIDVRSTLGEGSTFTLVLPAAEPVDRRPLPERAPLSFRAGRPVRVVCIEDNPANARLVTRISELRGNTTVTVAPTGEAGLRVATTEAPDLVLLDLHLPDLPGTEVLRLLRADERTADVPIVIVSADTTPAARQHSRELGATGFLSKPLVIADLLDWIDDPRRGGKDA